MLLRIWNKPITKFKTNPIATTVAGLVSRSKVFPFLFKHKGLSYHYKHLLPLGCNCCESGVTQKIPSLWFLLKQPHRGVSVKTPWPAATRSCHGTTSCFRARSSPAVLPGQEGSNRIRGGSNENSFSFSSSVPFSNSLKITLCSNVKCFVGAGRLHLPTSRGSSRVTFFRHENKAS